MDQKQVAQQPLGGVFLISSCLVSVRKALHGSLQTSFVGHSWISVGAYISMRMKLLKKRRKTAPKISKDH